MPRPANIVKSGDLEWKSVNHESGVSFERRKLATVTGGVDLGCSQYKIPAGARLWPYHYHQGNEEAIYVLSGSGTVRLPDGEHELSAGDYVSLLRGEDFAHQVKAAEDKGIELLIFSTMQSPDVSVYPDSNKMGIFPNGAPGKEGRKGHGMFIRDDSGVDFWEGE